jgi:hypothetical protein
MRSTRNPTPRMSVANLSLNSVNVQVRSASTGSKKKRKTSMPQCRVYFNGYNTSDQQLSRYYPRPVGHDLWSLSERGRRGSKCPFSASFDRRAPSLFPLPPLAPYPAPLLIHHSPPRYAMRSMGGAGFPHRISRHCRLASDSEKGSRPFAPKRPRCTSRGRSWGHLDLG